MRSDFGVNLMLKGLRRIKGDTVKPKEPLVPEDLWKMFQEVNLSSHLESSVWIETLLCFRTLLRKCHLFPLEGLDSHLLQRSNVEVKDWGIEVTVPTSKTNRFKTRTFTSPVTYSQSELCVARQLELYWDSFGGDQTRPIITKKDGQPVSYSTALRLLKKWCVRAGITKDVGFHSLRRGAATHMYNIGVPIHDIKVEGEWQSLAVLLYLSTSLSHRLAIDKKISDSLQNFC